VISRNRELNLVELKEVHFLRRRAVRERNFKKGAWVWRTRAVDHCTESGLNPVTGLVGELRHEKLDVQIKILEMLCLDVWAVGSLSVTFVRLFEGCRFTFGLKYVWVVWTRTVRFWSPGI